MKREEIHSLFNAGGDIEIADALDYAIIKTEQEFASRNCNICKYWNQFNRCEQGVIPINLSISGEVQEISDTFSCSKWKVKT